MLIHNFLENSAKNFPEKVAVIHDNDRVTYNRLNTQADNLANYLHVIGVSKGDIVALLLENSVDYVSAYYATLKIGAVVVPLNPGLKPDGLQFLLNDLHPAAIITNFKAERLLKAIDLSIPTLKSVIIRNPKQKWPETSLKFMALEEIATPASSAAGVSVPLCESAKVEAEQSQNPMANISPDALASIVYTSGSTGKPKGVMLSHGNIVSNTSSICSYLHLTQADIQMVVLPFFYVMGKSLLNTHIAAGGTVVINNRFMYPADVVHQMIAEKVTGFSGVPSTYAYLLNRSPLADSRDKLPCLRYCSQAGGHMASSIKRALCRALPDHTEIYIMYGATEAAARLTYLVPEAIHTKIDSIGQPIPDVQIRILDEQSLEVPDGSEGELVAYGPNIMLGYWKDPQETARVLRNRGYHTGDIGYRDTEGFLYISSRKDALLKVGGHRINPMEIEDFLLSTDLLIETAVIGLQDNLLGNKLVAVTVPKDDAFEPRILFEQCAQGLPKHKWPSEILTTRALPKYANGKINREKCIQIASSKIQ